LKIWALEAFRGKMVFSGGFWGLSEILGVVEGLGATDRALEKCGNFFGNFGVFGVVRT
jgi:hypothetical protein